MENSTPTITVVPPNEGMGIAIAGGSYRIIISGAQTQGAYAVIEMLVPTNGGPGPHSHAGFQESFYVVEGEVEVKSETGKYTAVKGTYVNIPMGGMVHCFKNISEEAARLICTVSPAGLEDFFTEVGVPADFGTFLPTPPMNEEAMKKLLIAAEKYGQQLFPPDYLD